MALSFNGKFSLKLTEDPRLALLGKSLEKIRKQSDFLHNLSSLFADFSVKFIMLK